MSETPWCYDSLLMVHLRIQRTLVWEAKMQISRKQLNSIHKIISQPSNGFNIYQNIHLTFTIFCTITMHKQDKREALQSRICLQIPVYINNNNGGAILDISLLCLYNTHFFSCNSTSTEKNLYVFFNKVISLEIQ